ncbi:LysR substrate-binding domain-containing protein [Xenophilus azovorans]|uniref:LysR substrate-binding domain-containing protein n=1 Tax=Xenophilus TaxID=151754 RepID=UPI0012ECD021|nr:LysR substrate-binding domain-containing protein [Xenophilus azovorans]
MKVVERDIERSLPFVNFNQLRSFYAVAQEMSFTKAAKLLHVGQPTLTVQVRALEERYGVELFLRSARGLQMSTTGEALFAIAKQIFLHEEQAVELLRSVNGEVAGQLRVGTVGPSFVMKLVSQFRQAFPLVQVRLDSDNSQGVMRKILDAVTDVAITGNPGDDPRLYSVRLGSHEVQIFVNRDHPWAQFESVKLRQLDGQPMIMREAGSMTRDAIEATMAEHGVRPLVVMDVPREAVREAVREGLGIGIVSEAEIREHPDLHPLRISDFPSYTQSHVICLRARQFSRPIAAFLDLAEAQARGR